MIATQLKVLQLHQSCSFLTHVLLFIIDNNNSNGLMASFIEKRRKKLELHWNLCHTFLTTPQSRAVGCNVSVAVRWECVRVTGVDARTQPLHVAFTFSTLSVFTTQLWVPSPSPVAKQFNLRDFSKMGIETAQRKPKNSDRARDHYLRREHAKRPAVTIIRQFNLTHVWTCLYFVLLFILFL